MKYFIIAFVFCCQIANSQSNTISVDLQKHYQTIEGWGGALCWWANVSGGYSDATVDTICKWITDPNELNMNIFRYNIGGGDSTGHKHMRYDALMPGFKLSERSPYDWTADANQRKVLLKLKEKRNDFICEAFSNSPPWWMTKSGCTSGNINGSDNLKESSYTAFADYLTDVVKYYKTNYGITFRTLEPFNEPFSNWWKAHSKQEGCQFSQANQERMIDELYRKLMEKNMLNYCSISAMDANSIDQGEKGLNGYIKSGIISKIEQINVHSYSGKSHKEVSDLSVENHKRLWQSESGPLSVKLKGFKNNLLVADRVIYDIRTLKCVAWIDWQLLDSGDVWGLISYNNKEQTIWKTKNFYTRMLLSRFIKPGYTVVESEKGTLAAISPDGKSLCLVIINQTDITRQYKIRISSLQPVDKKYIVKVYRTSANENCQQVISFATFLSDIDFKANGNSINTLEFQLD